MGRTPNLDLSSMSSKNHCDKQLCCFWQNTVQV